MRMIKLVLVMLLGMALSGCPSKNDAVIAAQIAALACDGAAVLDSKGNAVLPAEATEAGILENVDEDLGSLADLYPGVDTTTDAFYPNLPCESSIGGTLPAEDPIAAEELATDEYLAKFDSTKGAEVLNALKASPRPSVPLDSFVMGDCFVLTEGSAAAPGTRTKMPCSDPSFLNSAMPFEGRDIIYVHGFDTNALHDRILVPTGPANKVWPADASEFLNVGGYFRTKAENYWRPHITEHLSSTDPVSIATAGWQWGPSDNNGPVYVSKPNRYLVVAWSTNQTIEYAQHTLLDQIQRAMSSAKQNVVTPQNYPALREMPFCSNGCIIIGHSTGPLITNSALGRAAAGDFGPGGLEIPRHIVAHVAFDGAISGSRVATAGLAVANLVPAVGSLERALVCPIIDQLFNTTSACTADLSFLPNSIMRDLDPVVAQQVWGAAVNNSPVPTVTFAGGHPLGNQGLTRLLLPGVDDGVVTMNSACGNPNQVSVGGTAPSGFTVSSLLKAFDFSENGAYLNRGSHIFTSQKNLKASAPGSNYLAGACTPYLSATGMVMPVTSTWPNSIFDTQKRYRNHYSFMQSLSEHSYDGGTSDPYRWPSETGLSAATIRQYAPSPWGHLVMLNGEESRAVTDPTIYTRMLDVNSTHLVKPLDMNVIQRGRKISFKMPFNIGGCKKPPGATLFRCQKWVWKRTYHVAHRWQQKQSSHYAYEYIGRR